MNKRLPAVLLSALIILMLAVPVFADTAAKHIYDETGNLTEEELSRLESKAEAASEECGISIYFVLVNDTGDADVSTYVDDFHESNGFETDSITMILTDELYYFFPLGKGVDIYSYDEEDTLWSEFSNAEGYEEGKYFEGISAYITSASALISEHNADEKLAEMNVVDENAGKRMVDNADLLDPLEESRISAKLDEISNDVQLDVVVLTVPGLYGMSAVNYADDYFDYNGYGFGDNYDGILFLVSMDEREWAFSTCGYGIDAFTDDGLEYMEDEIVHYLSDGKYEEAFDTYANLCADFVKQARNGEPYTSKNLPKTIFNAEWFIGAVVIGIVVAAVVTMIMKGQLKSVRKKTTAADYMKTGSLKIRESNERYLFSNVTRRAKPKNTSGGGTHRSSSGRSHGGRSGRF